MPSVASAFVAVGYGFVGAMAMIVAAALLTGRINLSGLLCVKTPSGARGLSPARVQLLLATILAGVTYLGAVINARHSGTLPEIPAAGLGAIGASQAVYLAAKAMKFLTLSGTRRSNDPQETP
jgi:hypothetical protein